jgi:ornithine carbamoyltransferase
MPEVIELARRQAAESGGSFVVCDSMEDAFAGADVVYPKSWAPFAVMEERTRLLETGKRGGLEELERACLETNRRHIGWETTEKLMHLTNDALYLHCLPADISGVSCERGEVSGEVFERFRIPLYRQAGYKPDVIAAMILSSRFRDPAAVLEGLAAGSAGRRG